MSATTNPTPWVVDWSDFSIRDAKGQLVAHLARQPDGAHVANGEAIIRADGQRIAELEKALIEIRDKWCPALLRDCREPDKTHCNVGGITSTLARAVVEVPGSGAG